MKRSRGSGTTGSDATASDLSERSLPTFVQVRSASFRLQLMLGAQVRWRPSEEYFDVIGHGVLWFSDDRSIIGAADVAAPASLTELRRALDRSRATVDNAEVELTVYDVEERLLLEDESVVAPRSVSLELTHDHTFIQLTLAVDANVRFNRFEVAMILPPSCYDVERRWSC